MRIPIIAAIAAATLLAAPTAPAAPPLSFDAYRKGLVKALTAGARVKEVDRYLPPPDVKPKHAVHIFATADGKSFWYVTNGFGYLRQPNSVAGSEAVFVELATYADRKDERIAEVLSLFGEAMHAQPIGGHAFDAWSYDTITLPEEVYGLRYFVLRPGAEVKMPRSDQPEQIVSVFTVIPLTAVERAEVANVGRERARQWVERHAAASPAAMLARWKLR